MVNKKTATVATKSSVLGDLTSWRSESLDCFGFGGCLIFPQRWGLLIELLVRLMSMLFFFPLHTLRFELVRIQLCFGLFYFILFQWCLIGGRRLLGLVQFSSSCFWLNILCSLVHLFFFYCCVLLLPGMSETSSKLSWGGMRSGPAFQHQARRWQCLSAIESLASVPCSISPWQLHQGGCESGRRGSLLVAGGFHCRRTMWIPLLG